MNERAELSRNVAAFCGVLRRAHGFGLGHPETRDALRAIEAVGIDDRERFRSALRLVCCASHAQTLIFDRAFDEFFHRERPGLPQAAHAPRHTRPGRERADAPAPSRGRRDNPPDEPEPRRGGSTARERSATGELPDDAAGWQLLRARYSPAGSPGTPLALHGMLAAAMRPAADALVRGVSLGRSRRWKPMYGGGRFDVRRTIRASLGTGGDPVEPRYLGHPLRHPRFVLLVDGSRSMADHTAAVVAFAAALCDRTARANVFVFSTALREVTRELRSALTAGTDAAGLGEAWGGGTKIGANLARFVADHGTLLSRETLVIVFSDGLDAGDVKQLEGALREIDRRSAGIIWLNPHAAKPGFAPAARAMRAALRYITLLTAANDAAGFAALAGRVRQTPRIRGRRR